MNNRIVEASMSMLDASELIREWFPNWTSFLDCSLATYHYGSGLDDETKITYKLVLVAAGSGMPAKIYEGETLYELLTRINHELVAVA